MGWKEWEWTWGQRREESKSKGTEVVWVVEPTSQVCFGRAPDNQRASREA